ncbi:MAG: hypothetical protein L0H93_10495 [Nocardioides sp.]|nr:hypothetical protein [Nocardioides sp.]
MSVSFYAAQHDSDIAGWSIKCACLTVATGIIAETSSGTEAMLPTRTPICGDQLCATESGWVTPVLTLESPVVNLSNTNARFVLDNLGLGAVEELFGGLPAEQFLGRVLTALAVAPTDEGVPAHDTDGVLVEEPMEALLEAIVAAPTNAAPVPDAAARWIECGRRPGYLQDVVERLHEVAQWAIDHGRDVLWD